MASTKSLLSIGLKATPEIYEKIQAAGKKILEAGYDLEMIIFPVEEYTAELEKFKQQLRSKQWDGVVIGFGLRGNPKNTEMFETLVNTASEILPGVKFGFSSSPDDVLPCVERNFGVGK